MLGYLCVAGKGHAELEVSFLEARAPLGALAPPVSPAETRVAAPAVELRKTPLRLPLLQRPDQLGHGARLHLRTHLLAGGQPDPLVWGGELPDVALVWFGMFIKRLYG